MQYDGLDQTGKTLVTPLLSSQGRVMVGKCDEIGGPYLQVMSETLIDGIETAPIAISHPLKTFTGGIASNDVQDNRNLIFKIIQSLPFIETRARTLKTYFAETLSAAQIYTISLSRSFLEIAKCLETSYKEYAQTFLEYLRAADNAITKTISVVRVEFLNIVLRTPKYLSGIVEDGRAVFVSAVSETGRVVTSIAEDGRAAFSSIQHYISGDFYITVQKTFRHTVSTSIERDPLSLAAAPYTENMGVRQLIRYIAFLQPYVDGIAVAYKNGKTTIARYCNEKMRAALLHTIQLTTSIPTYLSVSDIRKTFSWIDIPEVISGIDSRINIISSSLKEHIKAAVTQWKEYGLQFTHNLGVAETSARALTTYRAEFINLVLRVPKLLSGLSETGHTMYNNALSEIGRAATQISEEGRASFSSIINYTPSDFYIMVMKTFGSKINTSISQGQTTLSAAPYINPIEVVQQHPIKRIWLTAYTAIIGFTETVGALNIIKYISERLKTLERRATSLPYNIKETMLFIDSKRRFMWSDLSESTYFAEARKINLLKGIRETLYTFEQQYKEFAQQFSHGIAIAENTSRSILKRLVEFVDIDLPIYKWLSGISENGHAIYFNAVSETGKMVSILSEEGRYVVSTFQNYTNSNFWIEIQKTFKHKVGAAIFRNPLTLSSAPYRENTSIGLAIRRITFLQPLIDGIGVAYAAGKTTLTSYKREVAITSERHISQFTYLLQEAAALTYNRIVKSWIDVNETISATSIYVVNASYIIKQKLEPAVTSILHPQLTPFRHAISLKDITAYSPTKIFTEAISSIEYHLNCVAKLLHQHLQFRETYIPHVSKFIINALSTSYAFGRRLRVQRVEFINIILSIPKRLSGITETGLVYLQNSITEIGDTVSTLSSNGRLTISYIVESTQSGFTKTVARPISERLLTSHTIISRSMIHLLEETSLRFVVISSPLKRFVETIITSGSHLQQLLHVLKETTSMIYSRQSRVTSQLVHRLGIRDIEILNTWRAFIHSISTSYGFLRRPQLILRERVASSYITSRIITSHIGEILRTLQIHSISMFYNIKESISTIQSFRHRLAGLVTRPYTEIKSISKTTGARLSRNFATLKSYIKDSTASHEGDKK